MVNEIEFEFRIPPQIIENLLIGYLKIAIFKIIFIKGSLFSRINHQIVLAVAYNRPLGLLNPKNAY